MSSVTKRGAKWYIKFRDADGKPRRVATKALTKREAQEMAVQLERKAERIRLGLEAAPAPLPETQGETLGELVEWWFANYAHTQSNSASVLYQLRKWVVNRPFGKRRINELTDTDCEAWLDSLPPNDEREGLANGSINKLRTWCRQSYERAIKTGRFVGVNPWDKTERREQVHKEGDWIRPHEMDRIMGVLPAHLKPMFAAAIYAGLRRGEVLGLTKTQVDLERRQLIVNRTASRNTTKSGKPGNVPIVDMAARWFEIALAMSPPDSERVFVQPNGRPYKHHYSMARKLQKAARKVGITRYLRFHDLRHTTGVLLTLSGVPIQVVSQILRHSDIKITMKHYQHFVPEHLQHEAAKLKLKLPTHELAPELEALMAIGQNRQPIGAVANTEGGSKLGPPQHIAREIGTENTNTIKHLKSSGSKK